MSISFDKITKLHKPKTTHLEQDLRVLVDSFDFLNYFKKNEDLGNIIQQNSEYIMYEKCPICEHKKCFVYYFKEKTFYCFGANGNVGGSIIDFLIHTKKMSKPQAIEHFKYDLCNLPRNMVVVPSTPQLKKDITGLIQGISAVKKADEYDWVLENLFAKCYISILFGEGGCGKTWLLLYLCLLLTNGRGNWCGVEITKRQKVLLFEGDAPNTLINNRLGKLDMPLNDEYFKYVNRIEVDKCNINLSLSTVEGRGYIEEIIAESKPDLVIIDTLISFIDDEKDAEKIKIIVDELRKFAAKYNCHVLICHHSRKRESGEKRKKLDQSDVIGSSIITRLASIVIGVDKYE